MKLVKTVTALIEEGVERAKQSDQATLISWVQTQSNNDFNTLLTNLSPGEDAFYWQTPDDELRFLGLKSIKVFDTTTASIQRAWDNLKANAILYTDGSTRDGEPLIFGGFNFNAEVPTDGTIWQNYGRQLFMLPEVMWRSTVDRDTITLNYLVQPHQTVAEVERELRSKIVLSVKKQINEHNAIVSETDLITPANWTMMIQKSIDAIKATSFTKVVLSRQKAVELKRDLHSGQVMATLISQQPNCYRFLMRYQGTSFLGASPERLLFKEAETIYSAGVAGSIETGSTDTERNQLAQVLLADAKNRHEHAIVVNMITAKLKPLCHDMVYQETPAILSNRDIQHLYTPIKAQLNAGTSFLSLVKKMHPTPALGGFPSQKTLEWIAQEEPQIRGFFGAPIGWYDASENGEFAVGIRSLVAANQQVRLFAGCGIVADSEPQTEWNETALKFQPMLRLLGGAHNDKTSN
ncbi:isochorismate synthase MenF [Brochothrix campestris]|uniref:isochorismate synthase n=1 Tax=Brochothrix campestris TaxID=2757 RepID=UPI0038D19D0E